jgi:hypothetical protein
MRVSKSAGSRLAPQRGNLKAEAAKYPEKRNPWGQALRSKARWRAAPYRRPGGADEAFAVVMEIWIEQIPQKRKSWKYQIVTKAWVRQLRRE